MARNERSPRSNVVVQRCVARSRAAKRMHADDGYTVLEAAITLPAVFFLLMFIVQWAIVWHLRDVVQSAAQNGLRSAQTYNSTASIGRQDAENYLRQVAPTALSNPQVDVQRTPSQVSVKVRANVVSVIPFGSFTVTASAAGPVEDYEP